jgi:hypothetical protein
MTKEKITLEISYEQAEVISESVEFLSRILLGHLPVIAEKIAHVPGLPVPVANELKENLYQLQQKFKLHTAMHSDESPVKAKIAWDIHQVLRQLIHEIDKNPNNLIVDADEPTPASSHPLVKVITS